MADSAPKRLIGNPELSIKNIDDFVSWLNKHFLDHHLTKAAKQVETKKMVILTKYLLNEFD